MPHGLSDRMRVILLEGVPGAASSTLPCFLSCFLGTRHDDL